MSEDFGTIRARLVDGEPVIDHADDVIQVANELAQQLGAKPPLDARVTFAPGYVYDLFGYVGEGVLGRYPHTYIGRRVAGDG